MFILMPGFRVNTYFRLMNWSRENKSDFLLNFFSQRLRSYGLHVSPKAQIAKSVKFRHPTALVVGEGVIIEDDVIVYQSVTLGGARLGDAKLKKYPKIKKNTIIFSGVAVIGDVTIGEGCIIGANSVVKDDIPDFSVAVGAPARVVKKIENEVLLNE